MVMVRRRRQGRVGRQKPLPKDYLQISFYFPDSSVSEFGEFVRD